MSTSTVRRSDVSGPTITGQRRREHLFHVGMAIAVALTVFAGFARTYYLRPYFHPEPLRPLLHWHGLIFTSWVVLLLTQTTLVATHRTDLHRRLGVGGAVLAALMVLIGTATAITRAREGLTRPGSPSPMGFLTIPLGSMVVFAGLVTAGIHFRRRPDVHKRLMFLATFALLTAPIARLPLSLLRYGPPASFALTDLFLVPLVGYDLITRGRLHRATVAGGIVLVASQPLRLMLGRTEAWTAFASWLTQW